MSGKKKTRKKLTRTKKTMPKTRKNPSKTKKAIPKAIREQCWLQVFGKRYEHKCYINWCENDITVFDFHVGHDNPESKGGTLDVDNLKPICARCNLSMSNNYTIKQWNKLNGNKQSCCFCF